ncbi:MAG: murein biosynthesis integral membrane protein MurJ, partial [Defluviitaleaceae bacterium]|nr:murein biosynthesis integral membrane protein MurJ [Defluviitaleaceae bacterium]
PVFIPMAHPDDIKAGEAAARHMRTAPIIIREHFSSRRLLALVGRLDLLIGMRLHSLIFASCAGVPFAGISYDPKVDSFLKEMGAPRLSGGVPQMRGQLDDLLGDAALKENIRIRADEMRLLAAENASLALSLANGPERESLDEAGVEKNLPSVESTPQSAVYSAETRRSTGRNFVTVSAAIFFSKALGFFRDILFASRLGTTALTDAYQTIFGLPSLLFTSIGNAFSAVNIPDLIGLMKNGTEKERKDYTSNLFAQVTLFFGLLSLTGIVFAPLVANLLAPGLSGQAAALAGTLCRIMMVCLLFVNLAYLSAGILQSHGFFLLSALISIPFNLLIILSLYVRGDDIAFIGYMTTAGWFLQFFIQYPRLRRLGYKILGRISPKSAQMKNLYKNLVPILLGNSVLQVCLLVDRRFGTLLSEGTSSALAYGSNLFLTITSVFVVAMSVVVFPRLSRYCMEKDFVRLRELIGTIFQILLFILLPYLLLIAFYHREIIAMVYQRGAFDESSTQMTAASFLYYSFVSIGYACQEIFNRVFYAFKKYRVPMAASLACIVLNAALNAFFYKNYGITGISLTTALCMMLYALVLFFFLRREIGPGVGLPLAFGFIRALPPLAALLAVVLLGKAYLSGSLLHTAALLAAGGAAYAAAAFFAGFGKILKK